MVGGLRTYPVVAGSGDALFAAAQRRRLSLRTVRQLEGGKVASTYRVTDVVPHQPRTPRAAAADVTAL